MVARLLEVRELDSAELIPDRRGQASSTGDFFRTVLDELMCGERHGGSCSSKALRATGTCLSTHTLGASSKKTTGSAFISFCTAHACSTQLSICKAAGCASSSSSDVSNEVSNETT